MRQDSCRIHSSEYAPFRLTERNFSGQKTDGAPAQNHKNVNQANIQGKSLSFVKPDFVPFNVNWFQITISPSKITREYPLWSGEGFLPDRQNYQGNVDLPFHSE